VKDRLSSEIAEAIDLPGFRAAFECWLRPT
jgi:hypothetical protein